LLAKVMHASSECAVTSLYRRHWPATPVY